MKHILYAAAFLMLIACGKTNDHSGHEASEAPDGENPNKALYDQVMDLHDEVMPKMQDLYTLKKDLQEKLNDKEITQDQKKELTQMVSALDSASGAMMDWMHNFQPLPDSADQEIAREYLENEMEKIRKVRDFTTETLDQARNLATKK